MDKDERKSVSLVARKIRTLSNTLDSMKTFTSRFNSEVNNSNQIHTRLEELNNISQAFQGYQDQLELLEERADEERVTERLLFQDKWFDVKASLLELKDQFNKNSSTTSDSSQSLERFNNGSLRLPSIVAPTFSGDLQQWSSFIDSFNAMFHDNTSLAPVQKFHYLKSCLTGAASDVVKTVPITNDNYQQAYNKLIERYENPGLIIQSHIRALFDTPKVLEASASQLHKLHHHVVTNVRALESLNQPVASWDAWLVTLLCCRLDSVTVSEWQLKQTSKALPTFKDMEKFLSNRVIAYEAGDTANRPEEKLFKPKQPIKGVDRRALLSNFHSSPSRCHICNGDHKVASCDKFKHMSVDERKNVVYKHRLCYRCLHANHQARICKSSYNCAKCGRWHNTMLHDDQANLVKPEGSNEKKPLSVSADAEVQAGSSKTVMYVNSVNSHVILSTAVIHVKNASGRSVSCRAVLDSGSQMSFVTKECAQRLCLSMQPLELSIAGIGQTSATATTAASVDLYSRFGDFQMSVELFVLPIITNKLPAHQINTTALNIPNQVKKQLADPQFDQPGTIDMLLGADLFFEVLRGEQLVISEQATAHLTALGWIITGKVPLGVSQIDESAVVQVATSLNALSALSLISATKNDQHEEKRQAEEMFVHTVQKDSTGRFVVRLPLSRGPQALGNSLNMARSRFLNLERRLLRNNVLAKSYDDFMKEYISMGHMEIVSEPGDEMCYYLPHHAVVKSDSLTTKTRVVFDASAITSSGLSLNDIMLRGPTVQSDLYSILLRFRTHDVVLTADVEKMYRQVSVAQEDQDLQRILYRSSPQDPLVHYRLKTVTYGTKSAPFLATRCLLHLSDHTPDPMSKRVIKQDFYVDDLLTGADSEEECFQLYIKLSKTLQGAGMPLRKWCSNSSALLSRIPQSQTDPAFLLRLNEEDTISTLGLSWQPSVDQFRFLIKKYVPPNRMTKRTLLSDIHRIYDPIGFLTPVLIRGKIFIQQLWALKIDWDSLLPEEIQERWKVFYQGLEYLQHLGIPRSTITTKPSAVQIHGFCDASQQAFGASVYVRSTTNSGSFQSVLFTSKSRVTPMKQTTIPRLELCGAALLAEVISEVTAELEKVDIHVPRSDIVLWTDSMIVIAWINCVIPLKAYVANRVAQIVELTEPKQWRHVPTMDNPADLISRGVDPETFLQSSLWWNGPTWLSRSESSWPTIPEQVENVPEVRPMTLALLAPTESNELLSNHSVWSRLVRLTAWLLRFKNNSQCHAECTKQRKLGCLSVLELQSAQAVWVRYAQQKAFTTELAALKSGHRVSVRSKLKYLCPFIGKDGLLRVGGRLEHAAIADERKFPAILPSTSRVTRLVFEHEHLRLLHSGPQALLATIQLQFWPLRGRTIAKSVVHKCITCFRNKPVFKNQFMAALPRSRVTIDRPFNRTGVDFCGPVYVKSGIRRVVSVKSYIAVFVCFVTRAVHLELVSNLSSDAFLAAIKRFIARRGHSSHIHSDNGSNFVGANRELRSYFASERGKRTVPDAMVNLGIQWHFNPPSAPHFGGLWEAAVREAKRHLSKLVKNAVFNFEEMTTFLCQIEAVLNSRPLVALSDNPADYAALTPAHFLVGGPLTVPIEPDVSTVASNRLKRWKLVTAQTQVFWKRWATEYLPQLQRRNKWVQPTRAFKCGDLAILKEETLPPTKWQLVRVTQVHAGPDGIVRVVTVKTAAGTEYKRPTAKLALIPSNEDEACEPDQDPVQD